MEEELDLLQGVYPNIVIERNVDKLLLVLEHVSSVGKVRLRVELQRMSEYPMRCRPVSKVERGLSGEAERNVVAQIERACAEYERDLCLVQVFQTFVDVVNGIVSTCGVCLMEIEQDSFTTSPCTHSFHRPCFDHWVSQCRENRELSTAYEMKKTRRKQIESVAESELKMAELKVSTLEAERIRLVERKSLLQTKVDELSTANQSNTIKNNRSSEKPVVAERDKPDTEVMDASEARKRLAEVSKQLKATNGNLHEARKIEQSNRKSLESTRQLLAKEMMEEQESTSKRIPCPVCRTEVDFE
jgi:hypothetical protein